jgi:cobalt-zinc-cadmium efflux system protein
MEARSALVVALLLSLAILVVELAGGILFRSTALMADALHVVTDILAVLFSFLALVISSRPPTVSLTYGYHRFEVLASLVNGFSLLGIVGIIMYQAYTRLLAPQPIFIPGTVALASVALLLNVIASRILRSAQLGMSGVKDENVSSAEIHLFGDALASFAVILGATAVFMTGQYYLDPLVAALIGLIVLKSAVQTTVHGGAIILEKSPLKDPAGLRQKLVGVQGVADVHDLHIWRICSHITVASMHACLDSKGKMDSAAVRNRLEGEMGKLGINHVTIQLEDACCAPNHGHRSNLTATSLR